MLDPDRIIVITSRDSQGRMVSEPKGAQTNVRAFDVDGKVIEEGTAGDDFRSKLPVWAQDVYDSNMKAVGESRKK